MARQKTAVVGEVEYTLQSVGARWYLNHQDQCRLKNGMNTPKYIAGLLENVVVKPKVTIDDFDDNIGDLEGLVAEIESFLRNKN